MRHFAWIKLLVRRRKSKESVIISLIQSEAFSMEIKHICNNSPVPSNSKIQ